LTLFWLASKLRDGVEFGRFCSVQMMGRAFSRTGALDMLDVVVNGESREVAPGTTLAQLLQRLELQPRHVAVERNRSLVPRAEHAACVLEPGDRLEIVTLVGGG
jgi:sulfur carrier protein